MPELQNRGLETLETEQKTKHFLEELILSAESDLMTGAKATDVVTTITAALEDYPEFNSGRGSGLNIDGFHEVSKNIPFWPGF